MRETRGPGSEFRVERGFVVVVLAAALFLCAAGAFAQDEGEAGVPDALAPLPPLPAPAGLTVADTPNDRGGSVNITWEPRDRSVKKYNVQLFQLRVGGGGSGDNDKVFDIDDFRLPVGSEIQTPLESFDVSPTGLLTRDVVMRLRVVSEAA